MIIALIAIFLAGIGNFSMHRWLLEGGHPLVMAAIVPIQRALGKYATYGLEFFLLLGAMLLSVQNWFIALCLYGVYTALNAATIAWLKGMEP